MSERAKILATEARKLTTEERFDLVEDILTSVHQPDAVIDAAWLNEVKDRREAWRRGELTSRPVEDVFAKHAKS